MIDASHVNELFTKLEEKHPQFTALFVIGKSMMLQTIKLNKVTDEQFEQYKINWEAMHPDTMAGVTIQLLTIACMTLEDVEFIVNPEDTNQKAITMIPSVLFNFITHDPNFIAVALTATKELGIRANLATKRDKTVSTAKKDVN